ncbi:MAG: hypothetical protein KTR21_03610 [Rhodobacteraceae bacterium]|nr:hypothetical protein [Paracoccaceae bacterium]
MKLPGLPAIGPFFRMLIVNGVGGAVLGLGLCAAVLWMDVAGVGSLIARSSDPALPAALLAFMLAITCAGVAMASALFSYAGDDSEKPGRPRGRRRENR